MSENIIKRGYDRFLKEDHDTYLNYLRDIERREGKWQRAKTVLGDAGTFGKNVVLTIPDAIGVATKIPTRAAGFEYTPWDPGGYAQKWREDAITPWDGGIAGILPWAYSKLGGIPKYTYRGRDETGGLGGGTKLSFSGIMEGLGMPGPYKKTQEKMAGHSDDLLTYYLGDKKEDDSGTALDETVPWKAYASKNWTSKMTNNAVKDYDKQFNEDKAWNNFLDDIQAATDEGATEYADYAYNNLQEAYDRFKKHQKEGFIHNEMINELLPGYLEESSDKYRKELIDEYGMYPIFDEGKNFIDLGDGHKFYTAEKEFADQKSVEGKGGHLMMPDDFDMGIFKGFTEMDWAPYRYSSDEAMRLFENPYVRLPAEMVAWPTAGLKAGSRMLPKGLRWAAENVMPGTFSREGVKSSSRYLPSHYWRNWRQYGQLPIVVGVSEKFSDRGDDFR